MVNQKTKQNNNQKNSIKYSECNKIIPGSMIYCMTLLFNFSLDALVSSTSLLRSI